MNNIQQHLIRCFAAVFLLFSATSAVANGLENLRVHDVLMNDLINTPINANGELTAFDFPLSAMGTDIVLKLEPSRLNRVANLDGMQDHSLPYLYEGHVEGDPNSWTRIAIKDGKPTGYLFHYGKLLQLESRTHMRGLIEDSETNSSFILIEPSSNSRAASMIKSMNMPVDKEQYAPTYNFSNSPAFHPLRKTQNSPTDFSSSNNILRSSSTRNALGRTVTRAMRIGIVVDSRFNEAHQNRGLARALSIINSVDAIYQSQLGIAIIVEGIRVYDDPATDPMRNNSGSVDEILSNFKPIRDADARLPNDLTLVHLFSGHRDPNRVIGLGWISTACRLDGYDLSMSTPFPFDALLAAHEIAHNLGSLHDDNPQCLAETRSKSNTLMWPELSGSSTAEFSACSARNMEASKNASCNIDNIDVGVLLRSFPTGEPSRRTLAIQVTNKDVYQRSTELTSTTTFPVGTTIENVSAGCYVSANVVNCNHGRVGAQSSHTMSVSATLLNRSRENVLTNVELLNATDVHTNDNRAVIQLLTFNEDTGEAVATQSVALDDSAGFQQSDAVGGIGGASSTLVATLLLILSQRAAALRRRLKLCA